VNVYLTFDVEIWCDGWKDLDTKFSRSFQRYIYGHSAQGDYALPKTLETLARHQLSAVFFVEPLFAGRFGIEHLAIIVDLIRSGGHDIQLHLHPEWSDEIRPLPFPGAARKRQHLAYYTLEEQVALVRLGLSLMEQVGCSGLTTFRAGSFACNADTYRALHQCGIPFDSSLDEVFEVSGADLRGRLDFTRPQEFEGVSILPISIFRDGMGRMRHAQIGACSFPELREALEAAYRTGIGDFTLLSHNFEMLKPGTSKPDTIVVRRFESLCAYLASDPARFRVGAIKAPTIDHVPRPTPSVSVFATLRRHAEQLMRRLRT
jgi:peptidoglycan/xylan/chitin deacetylase (PgdA/CDA1 family)